MSEKQKYQGFTSEEIAAMKDRAEELKGAARRPWWKKADEESSVLAKIAKMTDSDRAIAERIHTIVRTHAPGLTPTLWYGMPAYAKDGDVVCFFTPAKKFKSRYASFGFNKEANLDHGNMWSTAFALTQVTAAEEAAITELVRKAVS